MHHSASYIGLLLFLLLVANGNAQVDTFEPTDSIRSLALKGEPIEVEEEGHTMTKSPGLALLYGLIPGGGQLYTEQYWKVPLYAIPIGTLVGIGLYNNNLFNDYAAQVKNLDPETIEYAIARQQREQFRDRRDLTLAIAGGVFILSLIDAYSSAHLYDFNVDEDLTSIYLFPDIERSGLGVGVRW